MKASEVIVTFSLSVAKHRRIAAGKNLVHGDMHFPFSEKGIRAAFQEGEDKISGREAFNILPTRLQKENAMIIRIWHNHQVYSTHEVTESRNAVIIRF